MPRLSAIVISIIATSFAAGAEVGGIRGMLLDETSQRIMPGRAVVFLCDAATGMPIMPDTKQPLDLSKPADAPYAFDGFWHAETDDDGSFEFKGVPVGEYRLFAQSWAGISGMPRGLPPDRDDPRPEPSDTIILHGIAKGIEVDAGETADAYIKQLGTGVQRILCDPEEEHNYVLIGLHPTLGDPVLGPVGWDKQFLTGVIGLTRMEVAHLTIVGLPDDTEVHVSLLNYDNSMGLGGVSFIPGREPIVRLPIYAGWSNGKYEPPVRLAGLTSHLEQSGTKVADLIGFERDWSKSQFDYVWQHGRDKIEVPDYGTSTVVDVLAADSYRSLRKSHAKRREPTGAQVPTSK